MNPITCIDCGKTIQPDKERFGTGYASRSTNNIFGKPSGNVCYECCGRDDEATMRKFGHSKHLPLYGDFTQVVHCKRKVA